MSVNSGIIECMFESRMPSPESLARTEPVSARDEAPAASTRDEEPVTTSGGGVSYRRRPGLSRFRRRT